MLFRIKLKDEYVKDFNIENGFIETTSVKKDSPLFSVTKDYVKLRNMFLNKGYSMEEIEFIPQM